MKVLYLPTEGNNEKMMENCTSRAPLHMWRWPSLAATPARENHKETSVRSIWDAYKCNILYICSAKIIEKIRFWQEI